MPWKPNVRPCKSCGKDLLWNVTEWPIETTPRHPELCEARAYVFLRNGTGFRPVDVRDLPDPSEQVYPQHVCPVWRVEQDRANEETRRAQGVLDRMTRE